MKIGVISDTHGELHPEVFEYLKGSDLILHAGDIGDEAILTELGCIAPVKAVYGNTDSHAMTRLCRHTEIFEVSGKKIYLTHMVMIGNRGIPGVLEEIKKAAPDLVIFGHTHSQYAKRIENTFFFNPGGGGQKRAGKRRAVGVIHLENGAMTHQTHYLD